ncbi:MULTISPECIES: helix-turn-helix transcriptional regulator, partial [Vibrio]|uniref:helix-turn-helix transcriptional regulator n=1 Tax=Vibrio TaxID=662 RepID=UPI001CDB8A46
MILRSYEAVVDGIASLIGPFCEIVLHSLEDLNTSAIKIANGENTGRQVGSPITDLALKMLKDIEGSERNFSRSYFTRAKGGVLMKSITVAIRNGENRVIGLLCINVDMDAPMQAFLKAMLPQQHTECCVGGARSPETFARNIDETIISTIETVQTEVWENEAIAPSKRNRELVTRLHGLGIFKYKDAVLMVANHLGISR